jgi:hypothetical protein
MYIKVEGNSDLVRDADTMAILNTNRTDYENYLRKRDSILSEKQQIQMQAEEINNIKEDLSEIKHMLTALLKDRTKDR